MRIEETVNREIRELEARLVKLRRVRSLLGIAEGGNPLFAPPKRRRNGRHRQKCAECGRGFIAPTTKSRHCSKLCRNRAWWKANKAKLNAAKRASYKAKKRGTVTYDRALIDEDDHAR